MVVQLPPDRETAPQAPDVEAGVIDEARARHRRERWGAAAVAVIAVGLALSFGLGGGGGGSASSGRGHGGRPPRGTTHASAQALAVVTRVRSALEFGLLAPGVGWAATDHTFYLTRDGGSRWQILSEERKRTSAGVPISPVLPDRPLAEDLGSSSSPSANVLAMTFMSPDGGVLSCRSRASQPAGVLALTSDAGRTWATRSLPDCELPASLSFIDSQVGYAVTNGSEQDTSLFRTTDGGARWQRVSRFPAPMTISFGNRDDGLALVTPNDRSDAALLYRTTDAGRSWQRSELCGDKPDPTFTVYCGMPISFGRRGVFLAVSQNLAKAHGDHAYLYATADAGRTWTRHDLPALHSPEMPDFSAPNAEDLFVYSMNGMLHTSIDGGRHWSSIRQPGLRDMEQMQFINANYGWALSGRHFDYTNNGGRSWLPLGGH